MGPGPARAGRGAPRRAHWRTPAAQQAAAPAAGSGPSQGSAPVPVAAGPADAAADDGLAMVRDRPVQAQKRLSEALRAGVDGPKGKQVREALGALADKIQLSPRVVAGDPYSKSYTVASGDVLERIGQRHLVPFELIMRLNGMTTPSLVAGNTIKVIQGGSPWSTEGRWIQAWLGDACIRIYAIGTEANDKTPDGTFLVQRKIRNPPYQPQHKPKSAFRESGAADNPLGTRWIDIGNHYGMHGTIDPTSIGKGASEGCIRLLNKDVEDLFDLVTPGVTKVTIKP